MKRRRRQRRSPWATVAKALLVASLTFAVLWQIGGQLAYERPAEGPSLPAPRMSEPRAFVTTGDVNLRAGPGLSHDVIAVLPEKTAIAVIGAERDGFARIEIQGREAWVSADFIAPEGSHFARTLSAAALPEPTAVPTALATETLLQGTVPEPDVAEVDIPVHPTAAQTVVVDVPEPVEVDVDDHPDGERWVEVDRSTAMVTLHEGTATVAVFQGKIGKDPAADGYYSTAVGTFHVFSMNRELTETPFAPGVYLTDWVGFDPKRSNGFHSPVRDAEGDVVVTSGTTTLGCVRLGEDEARQLFDFAFIGMRVEIHD